jgi:hemerythrin superfamily protein
MIQLTRRSSLALALATTLPTAASLTRAQSQAQVQQAAAGQRADWFTAIRQHHQLIERAFDELLARDDQPFEQRDLQLRSLDQLLTAHSLAEETTIYPALALAGMRKEAENVYMVEAHIKIDAARVEMVAPGPRNERDWVAPARTLRQAVLRHAKEDEEARLFPELQRRLNAAQNEQLSRAYAREFSRVMPVDR